MIAELKRRIYNSWQRLKYYSILWIVFVILLTPYFINSIVPKLSSKGEIIYNLFMFSIFILFIAEIISRLLFRINFKMIHSISEKTTYIEKTFNKFFAVILIVLATISYLGSAINYAGDIIDIIIPAFMWLFIINIFIIQDIIIGDNYLAYDFQVTKLENIEYYYLDNKSIGKKKIKLFLKEDKIFVINIMPFKERKLISALERKGVTEKNNFKIED